MLNTEKIHWGQLQIKYENEPGISFHFSTWSLLMLRHWTLFLNTYFFLFLTVIFTTEGTVCYACDISTAVACQTDSTSILAKNDEITRSWRNCTGSNRYCVIEQITNPEGKEQSLWPYTRLFRTVKCIVRHHPFQLYPISNFRLRILIF